MRRWRDARTLGSRHRLHLIAMVCLVCLRCGYELPARGADADAGDKPGEARQPIGQFLTISGTVDHSTLGKARRAALALQARAQQEQRPGILVIEIRPGSSPFHDVQELSRFLSRDVPALTTVAYIPETVTGDHVVLALACKEIVMAPEAQLGDISLGTPLDPDEQAFVINLVNRRHNRKVSEALALGMLDRKNELLQVTVRQGKEANSPRETRVVSRTMYDDLAKAGTIIEKVEPLKHPDAPGVITGSTAQSLNILVVHTAETRDRVAALYKLPREAMREDPTTGEVPRAMIIRIDSVIEPVLEQFVLRQIDRAVASGVNVLIFEIESPGGKLMESLNLATAIADLKEKKKVRAVAYIPKSALSGAAVIAMGCDEIYMHEHAQIGDAGAIHEVGPGGKFEFVPQKLLGPFRDALHTLAEKKHRPTALLEAMMNKDLAVFQVTHRETGHISYMSEDEIHRSNGEWIKGDPVPEAGNDKLLTVNGKRAHELHVAEVQVKDFEDLQTRLGVPHDVTIPVSNRTWVDTLIFVLNTGLAMGLLILLGLVCIYFELHFPSGFFGICACLCFGIFFWSRFLGGTAGWLEVILFLLGAGCLAMEVFVVPGFGVFGVSGIILCVFSLIMATQTFVIPATASDVRQLSWSMATLGGSVVGVIALAALFSRYLPSIPLFNAMILNPPGADGGHTGEPRLRPELTGGATILNPVLERDRALVGKRGIATTVLRPAGKAQIGDDFVDVVSEGPFISAGRKIEVLAVSGNRVVVREIA